MSYWNLPDGGCYYFGYGEDNEESVLQALKETSVGDQHKYLIWSGDGLLVIDGREALHSQFSQFILEI